MKNNKAGTVILFRSDIIIIINVNLLDIHDIMINNAQN